MSRAPIRLVFLAVDDEFAGEMQRPLYESHPEWVVGSVISTCAIYKKSAPAAMLFVLRKSGPRFLLEMARMKIARKFQHRDQKQLPTQLARRHNVEMHQCADINEPKSIEKLKEWRPDIIISTNFSHYIGPVVRSSIGRHGCWNLHKSLLPSYRGMAPNFHALRERADKVGATLHVVAKGFDTGNILAQIEVPVLPDDTVYTLNRKTSQAGGRMLRSFLENNALSSVQATPQPEGEWKNYTYPSVAEVRAFCRSGRRF